MCKLFGFLPHGSFQGFQGTCYPPIKQEMLQYHTVFVMQLKYNERSFLKGKNMLVLYGIIRNVLLIFPDNNQRMSTCVFSIIFHLIEHAVIFQEK